MHIKAEHDIIGLIYLMTKESNLPIVPIEPSVVVFDNSIKVAKEGYLPWAFATVSESRIYDEFQFIEWALRCGISNENPHLRVFAAGFVEMSTCKFKAEQVETLRTLMLRNENPNVRYITGFVLFKHDVRSKDVIKTIKSALKIPTLKEKAQKCLGQLKNENKGIFFFSRDAGN